MMLLLLCLTSRLPSTIVWSMLVFFTGLGVLFIFLTHFECNISGSTWYWREGCQYSKKSCFKRAWLQIQHGPQTTWSIAKGRTKQKENTQMNSSHSISFQAQRSQIVKEIDLQVDIASRIIDNFKNQELMELEQQYVSAIGAFDLSKEQLEFQV